MAFTTAKHPGALGKSFSLLHLDNARVRVLALKKAEATNETVLRLVELDGKPATAVHVSFAAPIEAAREIDAQEQPLGAATLNNGALITDFKPYQPRTFALQLDASANHVPALHSEPVKLAYDLATATNDDTPTPSGGFDAKGNALPAEMLPAHLDFHGVQFQLAPAGTGKANAIVAHGQTIELPPGNYNRVYLLAASANGDRKAAFHLGDHSTELTIQDWSGFVGQWDTRVWKNVQERDWATSANHSVWPPKDMSERENYTSPRFPEDFDRLQPGFIEPASLAWFASHHHTAAGLNEPYQYSYLFAYALENSGSARKLTLPKDSSIRILAISVAEGEPVLTPVHPLFDTLNRTEPAP